MVSPSYKLRQVEHYFSFGRRLILEAEDPDGAALTTTWGYYDDPTDTGSYGQLKQIVNANGSWTRYYYDDQGRPAKSRKRLLGCACGSR